MNTQPSRQNLQHLSMSLSHLHLCRCERDISHVYISTLLSDLANIKNIIPEVFLITEAAKEPTASPIFRHLSSLPATPAYVFCYLCDKLAISAWLFCWFGTTYPVKMLCKKITRQTIGKTIYTVIKTTFQNNLGNQTATTNSHMPWKSWGW